jgi:hypothetical protein
MAHGQITEPTGYRARGRPPATSASQSDRRALAWCAALVGLLAMLVRIPGAIRDAFWQDEIASVHVLIQSTPWGVVHQVARTEGTPPLWYALGWLAGQVGVSPHEYRAVSVIAGGILAAGTVVIARRLLPLWAATIAGLLVAFGWQFVMHGRELRAYESFAMLVVIFTELLLRELSGPPPIGRRRWVLPLVVVAGSLTNYFFLLSLAAAAIWVWTEPTLRLRRQAELRRIGLGLIPFLVWSPIMIHQYLGSRFTWIGPFTAHGFLDTYWEMFAHSVPSIGGVLLPCLLFAAVVAGCALLARSAEPTGRLIALLALAPVFLTALVWLGGAKVYDPRNLIAAGPFAAIALARLPAAAPKRAGILLATVGAGVVAAGAIVAEATPPTPYNTISADLIKDGWRPNDPTLLFADFGNYFAYRGPLEWYLPRDPYLGLGEPRRGGRCGALFVIAPSRSSQDVVRRSGLLGAASTTDGILVGRLTAHSVPSSGAWRWAHILVGQQRPACVKLIPETQIIAALRR